MSQNRQADLLKSTLNFTKFHDEDETEFPIFDLVRNGRITALNEHIQLLQQQGNIDEILKLVNAQDKEGKTPLQYAVYYNYQNLVLYLLCKGARPSEVSRSGKNAFHIAAFMGHLKCAKLIYNYERHTQRILLLHSIKKEMNEFKMKKSDIKQGILVSPDRHVKQVQERFQQFQANVEEIVRDYLNTLIQEFKAAIDISDSDERNPIHYAAINKFSKCCSVTKFLLKYDTEIEGYEEFEDLFNEVQLLELQKEKRIDPKQFLPAFQICENFLLQKTFQSLLKRFRLEIKKIVKEIINRQDAQKYTPLHLASFYGDFAQVQFLLRNGGDPKAVDENHKTDVLGFAESNQVRKYLVDLKDAARKGDQKSMNLLVNCGHDLNEKKTIFGVAPVHTSIEYFHKEKKDDTLNYVIKCNADLNISDSNGWTPLHHAAKNGDLEVCQQLCENMVMMDKFSNKGYYPIHVAALYNNDHIIQFLVENNADIEVKDNQQCTPLILAAKKGHTKSVKMLLDLGANIYAQEIRKYTALHYATFNYHSETVNLLCSFDADTEKLRYMKNCKNQTAKNLITNTEIQFALNTLWNSSRDGNLDQVRKLVMLDQSKINEQTRLKGYTPLILACIYNHLLVAQFLIENGADTDIKDADNKSAKDYVLEFRNRYYEKNNKGMDINQELKIKRLLALFGDDGDDQAPAGADSQQQDNQNNSQQQQAKNE